MRRNIWLTALVATFAIPACGWTLAAEPAQTQDQSTQASQATATQQESVADAARRAKEQKKEQSKSPKVFTNDDLPANGQSLQTASTSSASNGNTSGASSSPGKTAPGDEQMWRDKFAKLNHKLEQDQSELDVLERELGVLNTQYYGGDPMKGMQQGMSQADITAKRDKIDAKKKAVADDQQAIADAESDLQKAGGDPGWER